MDTDIERKWAVADCLQEIFKLYHTFFLTQKPEPVSNVYR